VTDDGFRPAVWDCAGGHQALVVQYAEAGDKDLIRLAVVRIEFVVRYPCDEIGA
jgi:hypothetical protein